MGAEHNTTSVRASPTRTESPCRSELDELRQEEANFADLGETLRQLLEIAGDGASGERAGWEDLAVERATPSSAGR